MKNIIKHKKGSAIALALVFATVLLLMGLAYTKMTSGARNQTIKIDERIKLDYLAHGLTEIALLKFQLFPADFYACMDASKKGVPQYLENFSISNCPEFQFDGDTTSNSTFNTRGITMNIATMTILTNNKWNNEVLFIQAEAAYTDLNGEITNKTVTRLVNLDRKSLIPTTTTP